MSSSGVCRYPRRIPTALRGLKKDVATTSGGRWKSCERDVLDVFREANHRDLLTWLRVATMPSSDEPDAEAPAVSTAGKLDAPATWVCDSCLLWHYVVPELLSLKIV